MYVWRKPLGENLFYVFYWGSRSNRGKCLCGNVLLEGVELDEFIGNRNENVLLPDRDHGLTSKEFKSETFISFLSEGVSCGEPVTEADGSLCSSREFLFIEDPVFDLMLMLGDRRLPFAVEFDQPCIKPQLRCTEANKFLEELEWLLLRKAIEEPDEVTLLGIEVVQLISQKWIFLNGPH